MLSGTMLLRAVVTLLLAVCLPPTALAQTPAPTTGPVRGTAAATGPVRVAIAGLVHGHVTGFMRRVQGRAADMELVGVFEPDAALRKAFRERYELPEDRMFASLEDLLQRAKPEAIAAFSSTRDHRPIIEAAAARGVHVMVEKPLAVSVKDARAIEAAAAKGRIHVITNYETTWYPSHHAIWRLLKEQKAGGALRKMVVMDGHEGPKEINVQPEFLAWLRDPVQNGGGALFDFGCYGANLMTWLMDGQRPIAVTATTQRFKPAIYPDVDDEATIVVEYPGAQGIAQASWNWPFGRKDLEVYAERAYADRHRRQQRARAAARRPGDHRGARRRAARRAGRDQLSRGGRPRPPEAGGPVVPGQQPGGGGNPRRRPGVREDRQARRASALARRRVAPETSRGIDVAFRRRYAQREAIALPGRPGRSPPPRRARAR